MMTWWVWILSTLPVGIFLAFIVIAWWQGSKLPPGGPRSPLCKGGK